MTHSMTPPPASEIEDDSLVRHVADGNRGHSSEPPPSLHAEREKLGPPPTSSVFSWSGDESLAGHAVDPDDLAAILDAWQTATDRLQRTHESLRTQVQRLTDELEAKNKELARRNRLADLGQMASHVAHEVRNGIVPLKLYLGLLGRQTAGQPTTAGLVDKIAGGFASLESTVNDLLNFTHDREPQRQTQDASRLLAEVLEEIGPHLRAHDIEVETEVESGTVGCFDPTMVRRALINLVLNAVDAMAEGGKLRITVDRHEGCDGQASQGQAERARSTSVLRWQVADSGPGIAPEVLEHLFDPFVTTKASGTGLGLSIVERIAESHGGYVTAENVAEGGAQFALFLPDARLGSPTGEE